MYRILTFILLLALKNVVAQPGAYGAYDMSFTLIDTRTNSVIKPTNKNYRVFPTYYFQDSVSTGTFKYEKNSNRFFYTFNSTPVGPAIHWQFTINVISGKDTMKIYFAHTFIKDTLYFQKGEYIATEQYVLAKSMHTFNFAKINKSSIYDYKLSELTGFPYFDLEEVDQFDVHGFTNSFSNSKELPNKDIVAYGIASQRIVPGYHLDQGNGSYSQFIDETSLDDNGIAFSLLSHPSDTYIDYNYEKLDSLLGKQEGRFSLRDAAFSNYFPDGELHWKDTNAITFAILGNLQYIHDTLWVIVLNQNNSDRKIFVSKDEGKNWKQVFSIRSEHILNIQSYNRRLLYAYAGSKIYFSENAGESWSEIILRNNTFNITDLLVVNDTTGFLLNNKTSTVELLRFNYKTGEYKKLLDNIGCCYEERNLQQRIKGLYYYDNMVMIKMNSFLFSSDLGMTWSLVDNECITVLQNSNVWSWFKGAKIPVPENYIEYHPAYHRCDTTYFIKSLIQTSDNKLKALCYYNQDGVGSPHLFAELKFIGLNKPEKK